MAPLKDEDRLRAFRNALSNWSYTGYVCFDLNETAYKWLRTKLDGVTLKELSRLMWEFVESGGAIDEVPECRPEWRDDFEFHYDLRFNIEGQRVYVETRLRYRPPFQPDEPSILVVNIHAP